MNILIRGDSVAAWCCAHLLTRAGFDPVLERAAWAGRAPSERRNAAARNALENLSVRRTVNPRLLRRLPCSMAAGKG